MRDPKRISVILNKLQKIWLAFPDLRLGQLIGNVFNKKGSIYASDMALYYIEDEEFIALIENFYHEIESYEEISDTQAW